jgi:dUTP pyrophosphatase
VLTSAKEMIIAAHGRAVVPTDLSIALPPGTYGRVAPRSGLAVKHFIDVGAGVVDEDYRGPLGVVLFNFGDKDFEGMPSRLPSSLIILRLMHQYAPQSRRGIALPS